MHMYVALLAIYVNMSVYSHKKVAIHKVLHMSNQVRTLYGTAQPQGNKCPRVT